MARQLQVGLARKSVEGAHPTALVAKAVLTHYLHAA